MVDKQELVLYLQEAVSANKNVFLTAGIFKRRGKYQLKRFQFVPLTDNPLGKQAIVIPAVEDNKRLGEIIFVNKAASHTSEITTIIFKAAEGTTAASRVIKTIKLAIETAKLSIDGDYQIKQYNIDDQPVFIFGTNQPDKQQVQALINRIDNKQEYNLDEAVATQVTVSNADGNTPAAIRLKGGVSTAVAKLVKTINALRSVLFVQQVQDNGTCVMFTFGKSNKPSVQLLVQRKPTNNLGPRSFGVNATSISDGNGDIIKDPCIAVIRISDKSGVFGYSGSSSRLRTIVKGDNQIGNNTIAGVPLTNETVQPIEQWLKSLTTSSSALQIANSWSEFVKANSSTKQNPQAK